MIYFKKVYFDHTDKTAIEAAFRKSAIKQNNLVQLQLSNSNIGTDKLFFGYENKTNLYFMRIKNSVEFFLPNILFRLSKDKTSFYYAFRLSTLATIVFFLFCLGLIFILPQLINGDASLDGFIAYFISFLLFLGLVWLELRITTFKIKKAIVNHQLFVK